MTLERQTDSLGAGSFSRIEKIHWQPASRDTWLVPAIEQAITSSARGLFITACGLVGSAVVTGFSKSFWIGLGLSVGSGLIVAAFDFQKNIGAMFETFRLQELSKEIYEKEQAANASRSEERVVLESYEKTGQATKTTYDLLSCTEADLRAIAQLDELSTRILQDNGLSFDRAKGLLGELSTQGFVNYTASNKPATWTSKGKALVNHYRQNVLEVGA